MTSVTLWILINIAGSNRALTVVERFHSEQQCQAARAQLEALQGSRYGACIRVEAAR